MRRRIALHAAFELDRIYDLLLLYGYSFGRAVLVTAAMVILGTIFIDFFWSDLVLCSNSHLELNQTSILQKVYFLIVTATTLGYGDITPVSNFGMIFVIIVLILSVGWVAFLTALFVKKIGK